MDRILKQWRTSLVVAAAVVAVLVFPSWVGKLWHALLASAVGSDDLQSYSAEYSWLANQMAHAMMGFFIAIVWLLVDLQPLVASSNRWVRRLAACLVRWRQRIWFLYLAPFLIPLMKAPFDWLMVWVGAWFPVHFGEFAWDKLTDLTFWFLGMYLGLMFLTFWRRPWAFVLLVAWVAWGLFLIVWWVDQKQTFDRSGLPPGWVRAAHYDLRKSFRPDETELRDAARHTIADYLTSQPDGQGQVCHLVIHGGWPVNRSDLAVALGTEFAARKQAVYYHTASRLVEDPEDLNRWKRLAGDDVPAGHPFRPRCVVIDDLAGGVFPEPPPLDEPRVPPKDRAYDPKWQMTVIFDTLRATAADPANRTRTVWVLTCDEGKARQWKERIGEYFSFQAGGVRHTVVGINLGNPFAVQPQGSGSPKEKEPERAIH